MCVGIRVPLGDRVEVDLQGAPSVRRYPWAPLCNRRVRRGLVDHVVDDPNKLLTPLGVRTNKRRVPTEGAAEACPPARDACSGLYGPVRTSEQPKHQSVRFVLYGPSRDMRFRYGRPVNLITARWRPIPRR